MRRASVTPERDGVAYLATRVEVNSPHQLKTWAGHCANSPDPDAKENVPPMTLGQFRRAHASRRKGSG